VVVYDRLIQEEVLALAKPSAERIYMGKPVGQHDSRQEEVHALLVRKAREGKVVVRLKGGDPFVFGRGGEEAEHLADHGIPFEVVPGVTSAFAAPLSAGIAVTHRGAASSVAVVTGHEAAGDHKPVHWQALAGIDTLVFLMGVANAGAISQALIENGKSPDTPAAMIQMAFWHDERSVVATLATIADEVKRAGIRPPATLVVGEVVGMRHKLAVAQRDLLRRADGSSRFEPAPAPDQLLRLVTAGLGTQVLGYALQQRLFDRLETAAGVAEVAEHFGWESSAAGEILEALVALGVLEKQQGAYRNLELASRYLRSDSPESLRATLLHQAGLTSGWDAVASFAEQGCRESVPPAASFEHEESCEAMARFSAPAVVEKLDLGRHDPVLLAGYGEEAYREAIAERWPGLHLVAVNPFSGGGVSAFVSGPPGENEQRYGAILLTGLLASADRGEVRQILETAALRLREGGLLVLHDTFLPAGILPPPEVVLGSLGRRIRRGGCRTWSLDRLEKALTGLGFENVKAASLPAGTLLVTARAPQHPI